jgi:hypothetical protein
MTEVSVPRELFYDTLQIGERFADTELTLTPEVVRQYAVAVRNESLLTQAEAKPGTPLDDASLMVLFGITRRVLGKDNKIPGAGVNANKEIKINRSLRLGETIRTRTSIANKYEKRGRNYVHLSCELVDASGSIIGYSDNHIIWPR